MIVRMFPLQEGVNELEVAPSTRLLTVDVQKETPTVWLEVPQSSKAQPKKMTFVVTAAEVPVGTYVGTCVLYGGDSVVHVYTR